VAGQRGAAGQAVVPDGPADDLPDGPPDGSSSAVVDVRVEASGTVDQRQVHAHTSVSATAAPIVGVDGDLAATVDRDGARIGARLRATLLRLFDIDLGLDLDPHLGGPPRVGERAGAGPRRMRGVRHLRSWG
jgi:hypothetical protein